MLGLFKKTNEIQVFAHSLADKLSKRYPPDIDMNPAKRVSENRLTRVLEETLNEAVAFRDERRLGVLRKAKLCNEFQWRLRDLGYSPRFVALATEGLTVYVAGGNKTSKPEEKT
jgi:hypothetical protein